MDRTLYGLWKYIMGILITTDLEIFIHGVLTNSLTNLSAENVACQLSNFGQLQDDLSNEEFLNMIELIRNVLHEPRHPKNTAEQDLWCKARGISHMLTDIKRYRKGGFAKSLGNIHTTSGSY